MLAIGEDVCTGSKKDADLIILASEIFVKESDLFKNFFSANTHRFLNKNRKAIVNALVRMLSKDDAKDQLLARKLFIDCYRSLDVGDIHNILEFIPDHETDKKINKLKSKSRNYMISEFEKMYLSNLENKGKLIKWIADYPTRLGLVKFKLEIGQRDLMALATTKRINLMYELYAPAIYILSSGASLIGEDDFDDNFFGNYCDVPWKSSTDIVKDSHPWTNYVSVKLPNEDQLSQLTFAASVSCNDDAQKIIEVISEISKLRPKINNSMNFINKLLSIES